MNPGEPGAMHVERETERKRRVEMRTREHFGVVERSWGFAGEDGSLEDRD